MTIEDSSMINFNPPTSSGGRRDDHDTGRDRAAFFFWQGEHCTIKDKGKSAFLTVKVDAERAPQVNY